MRAKLIKWIRYFFGISRTEANGVVVLAIILLLISFVPLFVSKISKPQELVIAQQLKLDSLAAVLDQNLIYSEDTKSNASIDQDSIFYFSFDPNKADKNDLLLLGLSPEISNRILKYRQNGGIFSNKEDLRKIYGLTEDTFQELSPYIVIANEDPDTIIAESVSDQSSEREDMKVANIVQFDINDADSSELIIVNGIGPILSGRIVKFRENLGGFVSMDQLVEVYGLEDYARNNLLNQAYVRDDFIPNPVRINQWSIDSLAMHPYIDFGKARVIVAYREEHGDFQSAVDLMEIVVLEKSWVDKLTPYLDFN
jgi:DNA uptake protein ComE-like DNA-binding protein